MKSYTATQSDENSNNKIIPTQITNYFEQMHFTYNLDGEPVTTNDYFGILKDMNLETKKQKALDTYKLIFRFSIEKLTKFLEDDSFILILMQYIKETQLQRVH
jgi:hypothetical protein